MKKFIKYFLIFFCLAVCGLIAYIVYEGYTHPFVYSSQSVKVDKTQVAVDPYKSENIHYDVFGSGRSMEPTLKEGALYPLYPNAIPHENDIVALKCLGKCDNLKQNREYEIWKRLAKINEQDCWWLLGDNPDHSWDSRNYGWVCPIDRKFMGVVKLD